MNLLIFVITFLLIVASISYQALGHYKNNAALRGVWEKYMRVIQPCSFNAVVEKQYLRLKQSKGKVVKEKEQEEKEMKEDEAAKGARGINFRFLTDPNYPDMYPKQTEQMDLLLKKLISLFYGDQVFFQEISQGRPNVLNELFTTLRSEGEEGKISSKKRLEGLSLKDPELDQVWYQLKRSNPVSLKTMALLSQGGQDFCFETRLTEYLSNSKVQQIRLYLAPRALLLALLDDPAHVTELLVKRRELYHEASRKNDPMSPQNAALELQNFTAKFPSLTQFDAILNYNVSKTNPADYE